MDAVRELVTRDDLGEFGEQDQAGDSDTVRARARSMRRRGGPPQSRPDKTVLVSVTMRIRRQ